MAGDSTARAQSEVRIGLAGVGYWGNNLLRTFNTTPGCRVTVICDQDDKRRKSASTFLPQVFATPSIDEMLARSDVDAVVVALPASAHGPVGLRALQSGKHCFVEKPLATSVAEARSLVDAAEQAGRILMVGHTFEYNPAVRYIRGLIDGGAIGDVLYIFSQRLSLGTIRNDVNALWNLAPHDVSMAHYWFNDQAPEVVQAWGHNFLQANGGIADVSMMSVEFSGGRVAQTQVSWLSPEKVRKTMIVGSRKMVVYDDVSVEQKVQIFDKGVDVKKISAPPGFGEFQLATRSGDLVVPKVDLTEPLKIECAHFVECVREGRKPMSDGVNGLRVVEVLEAATTSMREGGRAVRLRPSAERSQPVKVQAAT